MLARSLTLAAAAATPQPRPITLQASSLGSLSALPSSLSLASLFDTDTHYSLVAAIAATATATTMSSQQPRPIISYPCQVCGTLTSNWCSRCISVWYCSEDHLKQVRVLHLLYTRIDASTFPPGLAQPSGLLHPRLRFPFVFPLPHLLFSPRLVSPILRPPLPCR